MTRGCSFHISLFYIYNRLLARERTRTHHYSTLRYAMLSYVALRDAMLSYPILCCVVLSYATLRYAT